MRKLFFFNAAAWLTVVAACVSAIWLAHTETRVQTPWSGPWHSVSHPQSLGMQAVNAVRNAVLPISVDVAWQSPTTPTKLQGADAGSMSAPLLTAALD